MNSLKGRYQDHFCENLTLAMPLFVLRFYGPVNPLGSCHVQSICLTTLLFVCVEVLRPSQPNGVMSSAVSLPNHTFTGQA